MSLKHEFLLLSLDENDKNYHKNVKWNKFGNLDKGASGIDEVVTFDHGIVSYLQDSMLWVQSINPQTKEVGNGLNLYGYTVLKDAASEKLLTIVDCWINLFKNGPQWFELTGEYVKFDEKEGCYESVPVERDNLITKLVILRSYAEIVDRDKNKYILHCGI